MFIILTIFLFVITGLAMAIIHWVRPKLSLQGFLAVLASLAGLVMVILARSEIGSTTVLSAWAPPSLFPLALTIQLDDTAWYFCLALTALAFGVVIISIARLGVSIKPGISPAVPSAVDKVELSINDPGIPPAGPASELAFYALPDWLTWVLILLVTSLGLLAVSSANLMTLIIAWVAIDLVELAVLMGHTLKSELREKISLVFSTRMISIGLVLACALILGSHGGSLTYQDLTPTVSLLLILAASLRLLSLPALFPLEPGGFMRADLATILYLAPAAASFILLVRVASPGSLSIASGIVLVVALLVGVLASVKWLAARDEVRASAFWMIASSCLAIGAALLGQPAAGLAWSLTSLFVGGLQFSLFLRRRFSLLFIIIAAFCLSSLPFSPTWPAVAIFQNSFTQAINPVIYLVLSLLFLFIQSMLLAGYIRHSLRGLYPSIEDKSQHIEQWVWVLFPTGLGIILLAYLAIGWSSRPALAGLPLSAWVSGPLTLSIAAAALFAAWRVPVPSTAKIRLPKVPILSRVFPHDWLFRIWWQLFSVASRLAAVFSAILEGEGGILWALVLFALIFVFLQR